MPYDHRITHDRSITNQMTATTIQATTCTWTTFEEVDLSPSTVLGWAFWSKLIRSCNKAIHEQQENSKSRSLKIPDSEFWHQRFDEEPASLTTRQKQSRLRLWQAPLLPSVLKLQRHGWHLWELAAKKIQVKQRSPLQKRTLFINFTQEFWWLI